MKACNRKILELFYNAKHTGRISKPDAMARVGEDDEGLVIELTWRVVGGVIVDAKFRAFANPNAIAITSLMVDNLIGKSVEDALTLGENVIIDNLDEFRPEYLEAYDMVRACINETYNNYQKRQSRKGDEDVEDFDYEAYIATHPMEEGEEFDIKQIQRELQGNTTPSRRGRPRKEVDPNAIVEVGEKRGRGRPKKVVDESEVVQVEGEKRGRGRPRKEIDPNLAVEVGEKRGRGRPRKEVDPNAVVEVGEKRGRGRPKKIVDESEVVQVEGEKRGRGRPRKEIDPNTVVEIGEKRGRGRPRKEVDTNEIVEVSEKRGRGRPKKVVDESEVVQVEGEKRGRGRPRKVVDPNAIVEMGEKRGRGRPKKEVKFNLPNDLDEVIGDEDVEQLISGTTQPVEDTLSSNDFVNDIVSNKLVDEDDNMFDADYDLFKSNIRNILSGKEVANQNYHANVVNDETLSQPIPKFEQTNQFSDIEEDEQEDNELTFEDIEKTSQEDDAYTQNDVEEEVKRGRGRPRKVVDPNLVVEEGEKRGRGRPKKIVIEEVEDDTVKRGRGRPRIEPINSLTRSLTPNSMPSHTNQDIVFASKNVTTTNININVTKTTTSVEDNKATSDDYSHTTNISQQKVEISLPNNISKDDEIEPDDDLEIKSNNIDEFDDEEVDTSNIKDEAPSGGIEDLLKALLDD